MQPVEGAVDQLGPKEASCASLAGVGSGGRQSARFSGLGLSIEVPVFQAERAEVRPSWVTCSCCISTCQQFLLPGCSNGLTIRLLL